MIPSLIDSLGTVRLYVNLAVFPTMLRPKKLSLGISLARVVNASPVTDF